MSVKCKCKQKDCEGSCTLGLIIVQNELLAQERKIHGIQTILNSLANNLLRSQSFGVGTPLLNGGSVFLLGGIYFSGVPLPSTGTQLQTNGSLTVENFKKLINFSLYGIYVFLAEPSTAYLVIPAIVINELIIQGYLNGTTTAPVTSSLGQTYFSVNY